MKKIFSILFIVPYLMFSQDSLSLSKAIENGLQKNYDIRLTLKNVEINKIFNNSGKILASLNSLDSMFFDTITYLPWIKDVLYEEEKNITTALIFLMV